MRTPNLTARRIILFVLSVLALILSSCGVLGNRADCDESMMGMLRVTLPPSASNPTERCSKGINPIYRATFTMSPDDLEVFQRSTPITDWTSDASDIVTFDDEAAKATSLVFGDFGDGAVSMEVLIDTSSRDEHVVHYEAAFVD
jgi:hypothetical protein